MFDFNIKIIHQFIDPIKEREILDIKAIFAKICRPGIQFSYYCPMIYNVI